MHKQFLSLSSIRSFAFTSACAILAFTAAPLQAQTKPVITGHVYTGTTGVAKATVTAYSIGQSSQTSLASTTTDTSGNFYFNGTGHTVLTCTSGTPVYLVASNIVPHAYASENPSTTASYLLVTPGNCGAFTTLTINERTTVAALTALYNFTNLAISPVKITYGLPNTSYLTQFTAANTVAGQLVDPSSGASPGTLPTGYAVTSTDLAKINSVADALYTCTSADPAAGTGTGTACGTLFAAATSTPGLGTTAPTNTVSAMVDFADFTSSISPTSTLYTLPTTSQPFQPIWTSVPFDIIARVGAPTTTPTISATYVTGAATVTMVTVPSSGGGGTPGAVIWYTNDGSQPTIGGGTSKQYVGPFLSYFNNSPLLAIAQEVGLAPSAVSSPYALSVTTGPHLVVAYTTRPIKTGASTTGTVSCSGTCTSTYNVTLTSSVPNALSFSSSTATPTTTLTVNGTASTGFTIYGISAGTSNLTATASGIVQGSQSIRSTSLVTGNTVTSKSPLSGFTAVNSQAFNNNYEPLTLENDAYQVVSGDPGKFVGTVINVTWGDLEPAQGSFDFSYIESAISAFASATNPSGNPVKGKIRFWAGLNVPQWLLNNEPDGYGNMGAFIGNPANQQALFWSSDYESQFQAMMTALATEYDTRDMIAEMVVSPCTDSTDEPYVIDGSTMYTGSGSHPSMQTLGYTDEAKMHCLQDASTDYGTFSLTPLYLPFNPITTYDAGHELSYPGFAFQQMQQFASAKGSEALLANQDLRTLNCLFPANPSTCSVTVSSTPIFEMFPFVTYLVSGTPVQANVSLQIDPQGAQNQGCTQPGGDPTDYSCYQPFIQWALTPSMNKTLAGGNGFTALSLELYPTSDDKVPNGSDVLVTPPTPVVLSAGDLGNLIVYF